jgi:hypothetical protein
MPIGISSGCQPPARDAWICPGSSTGTLSEFLPSEGFQSFFFQKQLLQEWCKYKNAKNLMWGFDIGTDLESHHAEESAFERLSPVHGTVSCATWGKREYSSISWWEVQVPDL